MQIKTLFRAAAIAPLAGALLLTNPADAAGPTYTIAAGHTVLTSITNLSFQLSSCSQAVADSALNGTDARIVNVSAFAGRNVIINWSATGASGTGLMTSYFYKADCDRAVDAANASQQTSTPGPWRQKIPGGTKWMAIDALGFVDIKFTITAV